MRLILVKILLFLLLITVLLPLGAFAQTPASIVEVDKIQQDALNQLDEELSLAKQELNMRKERELKVIDQSEIKDKKKESLKKKIENKYIDFETQLDDKFSLKKKKLISYYTQMKKEILDAMPKTPAPQKKEKVIFIPPQKLIGKWHVSGEKYIGTLRFDSHKGVLISRVHFFMYNKWDDLFNLTYDGHNIAFDYENPYGVKLHFEGQINKKAKEIKGRLFDLKTDQVYPWRAYR